MSYSKLIVPALLLLLCGNAFAEETPATIQATTASGEKVILRANGRWEYVDAEKAVAAKKIADQFPENRGDVQGGMFGTRRILPGDPDYNRGSLNPKLR